MKKFAIKIATLIIVALALLLPFGACGYTQTTAVNPLNGLLLVDPKDTKGKKEDGLLPPATSTIEDYKTGSGPPSTPSLHSYRSRNEIMVCSQSEQKASGTTKTAFTLPCAN